jgi:hypothetical protein
MKWNLADGFVFSAWGQTVMGQNRNKNVYILATYSCKHVYIIIIIIIIIN